MSNMRKLTAQDWHRLKLEGTRFDEYTRFGTDAVWGMGTAQFNNSIIHYIVWYRPTGWGHSSRIAAAWFRSEAEASLVLTKIRLLTQ